MISLERYSRGSPLPPTGPIEAVTDMGGEGKLQILTDWDHRVSLERTSYRVLESTNQIAAEMFPILSKQQTYIGPSSVNRYEWVYTPASHHTTTHGMKVECPGQPHRLAPIHRFLHGHARVILNDCH